MNKRPKTKPEIKSIDLWIEFLAWTTLAVLWFWVLWNYAKLPETIPTHFNAGGIPDDFGGKTSILTLPIIASLLFLLLSVLNRLPHLFNYSVRITNENAAPQYANATRMIRVLKFSISFISLFIAVMTIRTATGKSEGLGWWFILVVLGLIVGPVVYFLNRSYQIKP